MLNRLFGNYLVEKGKLTLEQLNILLPVKKEFKAGLEIIAVVTKAMTPTAVQELINSIDKEIEHFGETAVNQGMITDDKLDELLTYQSNDFMKFAQLLVDHGYVLYDTINHEMDEFQQKRDLSDVQLSALIHDDLDQCINIFVPLKSPQLKELAKTLVQTMRRLIDKDVYLEKAYTAHSVQLDKYACQMIVGDMHLKFYISASNDGLLAIANHFTGDTYATVTEDALDSVGEFINCVNGLFATNMSYDNISVDMNSPEYAMEGPFISNEMLYVIPMHVNGYSLRTVFEVYQ
ncbi:MAG: chemotaxis protein CheX [Lachnospiraceae bacterium]|nr:chemotaxis protein CheX [Lachnospiraceae bacterium]